MDADDVWIRAIVTILKNVTTDKGTIIGASNVMTKDIARYSLQPGARHAPSNGARKISRKGDFATANNTF